MKNSEKRLTRLSAFTKLGTWLLVIPGGPSRLDLAVLDRNLPYFTEDYEDGDTVITRESRVSLKFYNLSLCRAAAYYTSISTSMSSLRNLKEVCSESRTASSQQAALLSSSLYLPVAGSPQRWPSVP